MSASLDAALSVMSAPRGALAGRDFTVGVAVWNASSEALTSAGVNPLHLTYRWADEAHDVEEPLRTVLWRTVDPYGTGIYDVRIRAPRTPGTYELTLTFVREHVRWFDQGEGTVAARITVEIQPAGALLPFDPVRYERRKRSQNGEDGILAELLLRVGWRHRFIVEFGVEDGFECNAATLIEEYGWGGLLMEADGEKYARLRQRFGEHHGLTLLRATVDRDNVAPLFEQARVPKEFDALSIDIDGNDYWVWEALAGYRPRIVVVEYNPAYPPPVRWVMAYNPAHRWRGDTYYGASLASLAALGSRLGYALVATDSRGVNAFFVRSDLAETAALREAEPSEAYTAPAVRHPEGSGPGVEI